MAEAKTQNLQKTSSKEEKKRNPETPLSSSTGTTKIQNAGEEPLRVKVKNNGTGSIDYGGAGRAISFDLGAGEVTEIRVTRNQFEEMQENFKKYRQLSITEI